MNFTPLRPVNDLHGDEFNPLTGGSEGQQLFGFDFKLIGAELNPVQRRQTHQAESTLAIRKRASGHRGKPAAHPSIHPAANEWHLVCLAHAIAHDQRRFRLSGPLQKLSNVRRSVLPVAIHA
jgi:hypothetical protein